MSYRLTFISLFVLFFNHVLTNSKPKKKEDSKIHREHHDEQKKLREYHEIVHCSLKFAKNQDEKQLREELRKGNFSISTSSTLALVAKDLREKSNLKNLGQDEFLKRISASYFLDSLAKKQGRPLFRKMIEDHPYSYTFILVFATLRLVGTIMPKLDDLMNYERNGSTLARWFVNNIVGIPDGYGY